MSSTCNSVIGALKDSLSKADLDPRAREVLKGRLEYHREKSKQRRSAAQHGHISKIQKISAQRRKERGRKKTQELLPLILKLRKKGRTYGAIEDHLRAAGVTNIWGNPYSSNVISRMVRDNSPPTRPPASRRGSVGAGTRRFGGR